MTRAATYHRISKRPFSLGKSILAICVIGFLPALDANPVADWNALFTKCIAAEVQSPALAARNLATFHLAIASAIEATQGRPESDQLLAGASAARSMGQMLFYGEAARFDALLPADALNAEQAKLVEIGRASACRKAFLSSGEASLTRSSMS